MESLSSLHVNEAPKAEVLPKSLVAGSGAGSSSPTSGGSSSQAAGGAAGDSSSSSSSSPSSLSQAKPHDLEQHIKKLISQNAAIIETLDPLWNKKWNSSSASRHHSTSSIPDPTSSSSRLQSALLGQSSSAPAAAAVAAGGAGTTTTTGASAGASGTGVHHKSLHAVTASAVPPHHPHVVQHPHHHHRHSMSRLSHLPIDPVLIPPPSTSHSHHHNNNNNVSRSSTSVIPTIIESGPVTVVSPSRLMVGATGDAGSLVRNLLTSKSPLAYGQAGGVICMGKKRYASNNTTGSGDGMNGEHPEKSVIRDLLLKARDKDTCSPPSSVPASSPSPPSTTTMSTTSSSPSFPTSMSPPVPQPAILDSNGNSLAHSSLSQAMHACSSCRTCFRDKNNLEAHQAHYCPEGLVHGVTPPSSSGQMMMMSGESASSVVRNPCSLSNLQDSRTEQDMTSATEVQRKISVIEMNPSVLHHRLTLQRQQQQQQRMDVDASPNGLNRERSSLGTILKKTLERREKRKISEPIFYSNRHHVAPVFPFTTMSSSSASAPAPVTSQSFASQSGGGSACKAAKRVLPVDVKLTEETEEQEDGPMDPFKQQVCMMLEKAKERTSKLSVDHQTHPLVPQVIISSPVSSPVTVSVAPPAVIVTPVTTLTTTLTPVCVPFPVSSSSSSSSCLSTPWVHPMSSGPSSPSFLSSSSSSARTGAWVRGCVQQQDHHESMDERMERRVKVESGGEKKEEEEVTQSLQLLPDYLPHLRSSHSPSSSLMPPATRITLMGPIVFPVLERILSEDKDMIEFQVKDPSAEMRVKVFPPPASSSSCLILPSSSSLLSSTAAAAAVTSASVLHANIMTPTPALLTTAGATAGTTAVTTSTGAPASRNSPLLKPAVMMQSSPRDHETPEERGTKTTARGESGERSQRSEGDGGGDDDGMKTGTRTGSREEESGKSESATTPHDSSLLLCLPTTDDNNNDCQRRQEDEKESESMTMHVDPGLEAGSRLSFEGESATRTTTGGVVGEEDRDTRTRRAAGEEKQEKAHKKDEDTRTAVTTTLTSSSFSLSSSLFPVTDTRGESPDHSRNDDDPHEAGSTTSTTTTTTIPAADADEDDKTCRESSAATSDPATQGHPDGERRTRSPATPLLLLTHSQELMEQEESHEERVAEGQDGPHLVVRIKEEAEDEGMKDSGSETPVTMMRSRPTSLAFAPSSLPSSSPVTTEGPATTSSTGLKDFSASGVKHSPSSIPSSCSSSSNSSDFLFPLSSCGLVASNIHSPDTPRTEKSVLQQYLNGHAYTYIGLKTSTRSTYCCIYRPQPMIVAQETDSRLSMYSNWRTSAVLHDPLVSDLSPRGILSSYDSSPTRFKNSIPGMSPAFYVLSGGGTTSDPSDYHLMDKTSTTDSQTWISESRQRREETTASTACSKSLQRHQHQEAMLVDDGNRKISNCESACDNMTDGDDVPFRKISEDRTSSTSYDSASDAGGLSHQAKRVKIFEGGFKSSEDYTYVRGRGRGKYVCEECGIRCKKPSMLKKHIRTHTDLRPYSCRHCAFAFKTKGNLTKHMKSKAHHKKCVELGIFPVPVSIDDSQIDSDALAKQEAMERNCNGGHLMSDDGSDNDDDEDEDMESDEDEDGVPIPLIGGNNHYSHVSSHPIFPSSVHHAVSPLHHHHVINSQQPPVYGNGSASSFSSVSGIQGNLNPSTSSSSPAGDPDASHHRHQQLISSAMDAMSLKDQQNNKCSRRPSVVVSNNNNNSLVVVGAGVNCVAAAPALVTTCGGSGGVTGNGGNTDPTATTEATEEHEVAQSLLFLSGSWTESNGNSNCSGSRIPLSSSSASPPNQRTSSASFPNTSSSSMTGAVAVRSPATHAAGGAVTTPVTSSASLTSGSSMTMRREKVPLIVPELHARLSPPSTSGHSISAVNNGSNTSSTPVKRKISILETTLMPGSNWNPYTNPSRTRSFSFNDMSIMSRGVRAATTGMTGGTGTGAPLHSSPSSHFPLQMPLSSSSSSSSLLPTSMAGTTTTMSTTPGTTSLCSEQGMRHGMVPASRAASPPTHRLLPASGLVSSLSPPGTRAALPPGNLTVSPNASQRRGGSPSHSQQQISMSRHSTTHLLPLHASPDRMDCLNAARSASFSSTHSPPQVADKRLLMEEKFQEEEEDRMHRRFSTSVLRSGTWPQVDVPAALLLHRQQQQRFKQSTSPDARATTTESREEEEMPMDLSRKNSDASSLVIVAAAGVQSAPVIEKRSPSAAATAAAAHVVEEAADDAATNTMDVDQRTRPRQDFIPIPLSSGSEAGEGKCVCTLCNEVFPKPSALKLHVYAHYIERPYRCNSCAVSFRTSGHLKKHKRSTSHMNKLNMNKTFGTPSSDNPRPFKCSDCKVAFRIHGHLAKHLRSKLHIMKLECLNKLPFGMYAEMERTGLEKNLAQIDTSNCENSLLSVQSLSIRMSALPDSSLDLSSIKYPDLEAMGLPSDGEDVGDEDEDEGLPDEEVMQLAQQRQQLQSPSKRIRGNEDVLLSPPRPTLTGLMSAPRSPVQELQHLQHQHQQLLLMQQQQQQQQHHQQVMNGRERSISFSGHHSPSSSGGHSHHQQQQHQQLLQSQQLQHDLFQQQVMMHQQRQKQRAFESMDEQVQHHLPPHHQQNLQHQVNPYPMSTMPGRRFTVFSTEASVIARQAGIVPHNNLSHLSSMSSSSSSSSGLGSQGNSASSSSQSLASIASIASISSSPSTVTTSSSSSSSSASIATRSNTCSICQQVFKSTKFLQVHLYTDHPSKPSPVVTPSSSPSSSSLVQSS